MPFIFVRFFSLVNYDYGYESGGESLKNKRIIYDTDADNIRSTRDFSAKNEIKKTGENAVI